MKRSQAFILAKYVASCSWKDVFY